jgi:hypothetical protein
MYTWVIYKTFVIGLSLLVWVSVYWLGFSIVFLGKTTPKIKYTLQFPLLLTAQREVKENSEEIVSPNTL